MPPSLAAGGSQPRLFRHHPAPLHASVERLSTLFTLVSKFVRFRPKCVSYVTEKRSGDVLGTSLGHSLRTPPKVLRLLPHPASCAGTDSGVACFALQNHGLWTPGNSQPRPSPPAPANFRDGGGGRPTPSPSRRPPSFGGSGCSFMIGYPGLFGRCFASRARLYNPAAALRSAVPWDSSRLRGPGGRQMAASKASFSPLGTTSSCPFPRLSRK